jgi:hypothetical protein
MPAKRKLTELSTERTIVDKHAKNCLENRAIVDNLKKNTSHENSVGKKRFTFHY